MCKGAKSAVMAEIDYDESKLFYFLLSAVSSKDADFFLSGLIVGGGRLLTTAFSNSIRGRIA